MPSQKGKPRPKSYIARVFTSKPGARSYFIGTRIGKINYELQGSTMLWDEKGTEVLPRGAVIVFTTTVPANTPAQALVALQKWLKEK